MKLKGLLAAAATATALSAGTAEAGCAIRVDFQDNAQGNANAAALSQQPDQLHDIINNSRGGCTGAANALRRALRKYGATGVESFSEDGANFCKSEDLNIYVRSESYESRASGIRVVSYTTGQRHSSGNQAGSSPLPPCRP